MKNISIVTALHTRSYTGHSTELACMATVLYSWPTLRGDEMVTRAIGHVRRGDSTVGLYVLQSPVLRSKLSFMNMAVLCQDTEVLIEHMKGVSKENFHSLCHWDKFALAEFGKKRRTAAEHIINTPELLNILCPDTLTKLGKADINIARRIVNGEITPGYPRTLRYGAGTKERDFSLNNTNFLALAKWHPELRAEIQAQQDARTLVRPVTPPQHHSRASRKLF